MSSQIRIFSYFVVSLLLTKKTDTMTNEQIEVYFKTITDLLKVRVDAIELTILNSEMKDEYDINFKNFEKKRIDELKNHQ